MKNSGSAKGGSKKGFVFTILTLVIIVFMIIELNIYFRTYELKLQSEPGKLRLQVMNDFIKEYSPSYFNNTAHMFLYSALYALNNDSVRYPPSQANLAQLLWNISYTGTRTDSYSKALIQSGSTLSAYDAKLKALASTMGIDLNIAYSNFNVAMVDPWVLQYNFSMNVNMFDSDSQTKVSFPADISLNISVVGFEDPFLARMNFTRNIVPLGVNPKVQVIMNGDNGMGWFYGPTETVTSCDNVLFTIDSKLKIMLTNNTGVADDCGNLYGGIIILGDSSSPSSKINVPIFINSSAAISSIQNNTEYLILPEFDDGITANGYHYIINNSAVRDIVECGLYAEHSSNYDYLQRLTNATQGAYSPPYGIETIISGNSSKISGANAGKSYVDRAFYTNSIGYPYKGLPGCNSEIMCSFNNPYPTRLDDNLGTFYAGTTNLRDALKR